MPTIRNTTGFLIIKEIVKNDKINTENKVKNLSFSHIADIAQRSHLKTLPSKIIDQDLKKTAKLNNSRDRTNSAITQDNMSTDVWSKVLGQSKTKQKYIYKYLRLFSVVLLYLHTYKKTIRKIKNWLLLSLKYHIELFSIGKLLTRRLL